MIQFPCPCGHGFRLDNDQAGGLVQCPACRRLNDVPTLSEQRQIAADGTYKIDAPVRRSDPDKIAADLAYIYQKGAVDAEGNEIDLRMTPAELAAVGTGEHIPLVPVAQLREHAPRYDPESGELISPLDMIGQANAEVRAAEIPMAKAAINYASGSTTARHSFLRLFISLLSPINIAVMFAVLCMHLLLLPILLVMLVGIMFLIVAVPFMAGAILAHYGNVIEDTGPREQDELPRPLRDVGWYEDLWSPFCNVFGSLVLCYGPVFLVPLLLHYAPAITPFGLVLAFAFLLAGTFFFPAVVLTLQGGGTSLNLRPDRVMKVISTCGTDYFVALIAWIVAAPLYLWGWLGTTAAIVNSLHPTNLPNWLVSWTFTGSALVVAIFAMHFFCTCVGMLYRVHYEQFPWVLQRHIPTKKDPTTPVGLPPSRREARIHALQPIERK